MFKILILLISFKLCIANDLIDKLKKEDTKGALKIIDECIKKEDFKVINKIEPVHKGKDTALSIAIGKGYNEIAKKLIKSKGIELNYSEEYLLNLNYLVYSLYLKNLEIATLLLENDEIDVNILINTNVSLKYMDKYGKDYKEIKGSYDHEDEQEEESIENKKIEQEEENEEEVESSYKKYPELSTALSIAIENYNEDEEAYETIIDKIIKKSNFDNSIVISGVNYLVHALNNSREDIAEKILIKSEEQLKNGDKKRSLDLNRSLIHNENITKTLLKVMDLVEDDYLAFRIIDQINFDVNDTFPLKVSYLNYAISKNKKSIALKLIDNVATDVNLYSNGLTPLMLLGSMRNLDLEIMDALLIKKPSLWLRKKVHPRNDPNSDEEDDIITKNALDIGIIYSNEDFIMKFLSYVKEDIENFQEDSYLKKLDAYSRREEVDIKKEFKRANDYSTKYFNSKDVREVIDNIINNQD